MAGNRSGGLDGEDEAPVGRLVALLTALQRLSSATAGIPDFLVTLVSMTLVPLLVMSDS